MRLDNLVEMVKRTALAKHSKKHLKKKVKEENDECKDEKKSSKGVEIDLEPQLDTIPNAR